MIKKNKIKIIKAGLDWKIIFIAPATSQPRYHKRVKQILNYCDVEVFAFSRGFYEKNTFPSNIRFFPLGHIGSSRYLQRIFTLFHAILKIRKYIKDKKKCFYYALSFDCLIIAKLSGLKRGFYEVADLRQTEGIGKIISFFEKYLYRDIIGMVLTSHTYYYNFYKKRNVIPKEKVFIIENKVTQDLANKRPTSKNFSQGIIKIGLLGFLRYRHPIELLLDFVKKRPNSYMIECYGDGPLRQLIESSSCRNIRYHGSFKNPEELPNIYSQIDLNYVVYDKNYLNVRLSIPNKLYESAFFGVPIVCAEGTSVGREVIKWKIGKMIRTENFELFEKDFSSIDTDWLQECSQNCFRLPSSALLDDGERKVRDMLKYQYFNKVN